MPARLSRRKLSTHVAERLLQGDESVVNELAAMLNIERREREIDLLVRDIEDQLARRGEIITTVETAKALTPEVRQSIVELVQRTTSFGSELAKTDICVHLREIIKPDLIGGIKLTTPTQVLDATIAKKLSDLRAMKV